MEQSYYFEIIQRYLPQLLLQTVETLNEKHTNELTYLFKQRLSPMFSADGRWTSLTGMYTRVAADVVALDSELPIKSRDAIEMVSGDIPKMGMKLWLSEKDLKEIDTMIRSNVSVAQIVQKIFRDMPRVIEGIWERIEDIFLSELSTGIGLSKRNNGTGVRLNVGYLDANKFGTSVLWSDAETSTPVDDLQKVFDKAIEDRLKVMDQTAFALCREGNMPIIVFDMNQKGNLTKLVKGEKVGTLVHV